MQWKDPFGESWNKRRERYKEQSSSKTNTKWNMQSVIFKSGEDMRQEQMVMQFIKLFSKIWKHAKLLLQLHGFLEARKHVRKFLLISKIMLEVHQCHVFY